MTAITTLSTESRRSVGSLFAASFRNFSALWLLAVFVITFSITAPQTFPTALTIKLVLTDQVTVGLLALALLIPLCAETFDLSIGAMLAFSMVIASTLATNGYNLVAASFVALLCCALFGVLNGLLVIRFHINSFIATLGSSQLLAALALLISQNQQLIPPLPDWFLHMSQGSILGINIDVFYLFAAAVLLWYLLEHTPAGRGMFATGGNAEAARLAGVPTNALIWSSLVVSALIAGLAGILLLAKVGMFTQEYGPGYVFPAFAAVFFGATQFKGRPNVWGTLLAMYVLAVGVAGLQLTFFGNEYWITPFFNGAALLIAVALASREHMARAYRRLRKGAGGGASAPTESSVTG